MIIEHIFYSGALAILVGLVFYRYTGRDSSWIIILCAFVPDLDWLGGSVLYRLGIRLVLFGSPVQRGSFHNITVMVIFGIVMAFLLLPLGIKFFDALFFSLAGFGAHLVEDALVYSQGYRFLWPFSSQLLGFGILPYPNSEGNYVSDFFHIANTEVLIIGLLLFFAALLIRTQYERSSSWIRWYMPDKIVENFFLKKEA